MITIASKRCILLSSNLVCILQVTLGRTLLILHSVLNLGLLVFLTGEQKIFLIHYSLWNQIIRTMLVFDIFIRFEISFICAIFTVMYVGMRMYVWVNTIASNRCIRLSSNLDILTSHRRTNPINFCECRMYSFFIVFDIFIRFEISFICAIFTVMYVGMRMYVWVNTIASNRCIRLSSNLDILTSHRRTNPINFCECRMYSFFIGVQKGFLEHYGR